jgi:NAD(P)-dependent dehydrogenase (short-subunit alcohol dehydrogenase family)
VYLEQFDLSGKVALVTGGTGLLGSEFCRGLAEAGADIVVISRDAEKQAALGAEIRQLGRAFDGFACDLTDLEGIGRVADAAWELHGHVDIVVHNAMSHATTRGLGITDMTMDAMDYQLAVSTKSACVIFQRLCPKMAAGDGGSVITVTSRAGMEPVTGLLAYGLGKGSLILLTKHVAKEFAPKVRANVFCPGIIDTDGSRTNAPLGLTNIPQISAGRLGRSEECVGLIIYLASSASSYTNGQVIMIDGGHFGSAGVKRGPS